MLRKYEEWLIREWKISQDLLLSSNMSNYLDANNTKCNFLYNKYNNYISNSKRGKGKLIYLKNIKKRWRNPSSKFINCNIIQTCLLPCLSLCLSLISPISSIYTSSSHPKAPHTISLPLYLQIFQSCILSISTSIQFTFSSIANSNSVKLNPHQKI